MFQRRLATLPLLAAVCAGPAAAEIVFDRPGLELVLRSSDGGDTTDARVARLFALYVPAGEPASPFLPAGPFEAIFRGAVELDLNDSFRFAVRGRGSVRLSIGGQVVLERDDLPPDGEPAPVSGEVRLRKGLNPVELIYRSPARGDASLRLTWMGDVLPEEPLPPASLRHADSPELERGRARRTARELVADAMCVHCHAGATRPTARLSGEQSASSGHGESFAAPDSDSRFGADDPGGPAAAASPFAGSQAASAAQGLPTGMPEAMAAGPDLAGIGSRRPRRWTERWLLDPASLKPGARMPRVLSSDADEARRQAADLAAFLFTPNAPQLGAGIFDRRSVGGAAAAANAASAQAASGSEEESGHDAERRQRAPRVGTTTADRRTPAADGGRDRSHNAAARRGRPGAESAGTSRLSGSSSAHRQAAGRAPAAERPRMLETVGSAVDGRRLYAEVGCAACHGDQTSPPRVDAAPRLVPTSDPGPGAVATVLDEDGAGAVVRRDQGSPDGRNRPGAGGPTTDEDERALQLRNKWRAPALAAWLLDPTRFDPASRMPQMKLEVDEAASLAAWLLAEAPEQGRDAPRLAAQQSENRNNAPRPASQQPQNGSAAPRLADQQPEEGRDAPRPASQQPQNGSAAPRLADQQPEEGRDRPRPATQPPEDGSPAPRLADQQPEEGRDTPPPASQQPEDGSPAPRLATEQPGDPERGRRLADELRCRSCHSLPGAAAAPALAASPLGRLTGQAEVWTTLAAEATTTPAPLSSPTSEAEARTAPAAAGPTTRTSTSSRTAEADARATLAAEAPKRPATTVTHSGAAPRHPRYDFTPREVEAIERFLAEDTPSLSRVVPSEYAERRVRQSGCLACHGRDGTPASFSPPLGAPDAPESAEGVPSDFFAGPAAPGTHSGPSQSPPDLTWAGEKLRADWLRDYLAGRRADRPRPHLRVRMPAFPAHADLLAAGLHHQHGLSFSPPDSSHDSPSDSTPDSEPVDAELAAVGRDLVRGDRLGCHACHALGGEPALGGEGSEETISFDLVRRRLRRPWFDWFLRDPGRILPGTKMPRFVDEDGYTALYDVFDGEAARQFEAIWHYLGTLD